MFDNGGWFAVLLIVVAVVACYLMPTSSNWEFPPPERPLTQWLRKKFGKTKHRCSR